MDEPSSAAQRSADGRNDRRPKKPRTRKTVLLVDPLLPYATSTDPGIHALCKESAELGHQCEPLAEKEDLLKERVRVTAGISDSLPRYISLSRAEKFVTSRAELLSDWSDFKIECGDRFKLLASGNRIKHKILMGLLPRMQEFHLLVSNEQKAITQNRAMLEIGILSYPAPARIGQAYLAALADILNILVQSTDDDQYEQNCCRIGQKYFFGLIRNMYTPAKDTPEYDVPPEASELEMQWCPVTQAWHEQSSTAVVQIVPYPYEDPGYAKIFKRVIGKTWKLLWGFGNGMVLHSSIKEHLDQNRIAIVPDKKPPCERKLVVLDDSLLDQASYPNGPRFRDLHNSILTFKTMARPQLPNLYLRCLMTLARRRRHLDPTEDPKTDLKKVPMHKLWNLDSESKRWGTQHFGFEAADYE